ncbi:LysR family transcriptional regulator [Streptomyces sp. NPDC002209]|uniref:helix-turn-helix domain-containing protein n=1 Tax=Streptomyces sp. NPDC002209 TaxID=3364638 RepID=UPI0036B740A4
MNVIETDTAEFGAYAISPQHAAQALTDVRAIAGRVLGALPEPVTRSLVPADLANEHFTIEPGSRLALRATDRPGFMAPARAASTATAVLIALRVLEQPDIHQAGRVFREELIETMREDLGQISTTSIDQWGRRLSPVLKAVHLAAVAPSLRPGEQLRHRILTPMPRRPTRTGRDIARRSRKVPGTFWPAWTARITPTDGVFPRTLAPILAASLLIIDSRITLDDAAKRLGAITDGIGMSHVMQRLDDRPDWKDMVTALVRLSDYLDAHDVPIDYERRRNLDYSRLLPREHWHTICWRTGTLPGSGRRERVVRCHLFQRLSGLPIEASPGYSGEHEARFRNEVAQFVVWQTPELADELDIEARSFLAQHGIREEPVTWQPPTALHNELCLPGADPDRIDISHLHRMVRQRENPVQHAAEILGSSVEAVRHVLDEHPAPAALPTLSSARATGRVRSRARSEIPRERLARLYLDEHRSLVQIGKLTGFSRHTIRNLVREYDISLRKGPQDYRHRGTVERDWLFEQYVTRRRTLPDLARERGMSTANMARWAHTHHIPLRPRGGGSHDTALRAGDTAAEQHTFLRKALSSPFAWQRIDRFLAASRFPTITAAAKGLDINISALTSQIKRLERDLQQPLLTRAGGGKAMQLTPFGKRVVAAAEEISAEENTMAVRQKAPFKP